MKKNDRQTFHQIFNQYNCIFADSQSKNMIHANQFLKGNNIKIEENHPINETLFIESLLAFTNVLYYTTCIKFTNVLYVQRGEP